MVTVLILDVLWIWNDYLLPSMVLLSPNLRTLPLSTYGFFTTYSVDYAPLMAGLVLTILPVILLYLRARNRSSKALCRARSSSRIGCNAKGEKRYGDQRHDFFGTVPSFFGRTLYDERLDAMFFNWTASGFRLRFTGDRLEMDATASPITFPGEGDHLPWIAVLLDGEQEPSRLIRLDAGRKTYLLFSSPMQETHTLRVVKRSENSKGRLGLHRLILRANRCRIRFRAPRRRLEFVGDSITCGFGNAMDPAAAVFNNETEDGLAAYPALAAGLLDAEYQSVCISGIPLCLPSDPAYRASAARLPGLSRRPSLRWKRSTRMRTATIRKNRA